MGGVDGEGNKLQDMWKYDLETKTWTQHENIPDELGYAGAAVVLDTDLLLFGGEKTDHSLNEQGWLYTLPASAVQQTQVPADLILASAYPNPFNNQVCIDYTLTSDDHLTIGVFTVAGTRIRILKAGTQAMGHYQITWDAADDSGAHVPTGVYFIRLISRNISIIVKVCYIK